MSIVLTIGCEKPESKEGADLPKARFNVALHVQSEDDAGLGGVHILQGDRVIATTNDEGNAALSLRGEEGDRAELTVKCPEPYQSPSKPIIVGLRHLAPGSAPPRFDAVCTRLFHSVVVAIRAENGRDLPIVRLGQVVGKTDIFGVAHVRLDAAPNEQVSFKLDTRERPLLRPQNPTLTFMTSQRDELVLLEQRFTELKPKLKPKPVVQRPTRL